MHIGCTVCLVDIYNHKKRTTTILAELEISIQMYEELTNGRISGSSQPVYICTSKVRAAVCVQLNIIFISTVGAAPVLYTLGAIIALFLIYGLS